MNNDFDILYEINGDDVITRVNDEWSECAIQNDAPELCADKVIERSLWDFITDETTLELYRKIVANVRAGGRAVSFNFRCDTPDYRRVSQMHISLSAKGGVKFNTRHVKVESRLRQNIWRNDAPRGDNFLTACSWCKKIDVRNGNWQEVEDAVSTLSVFLREDSPRISHGMCPSCYQNVIADFRNRRVSRINTNSCIASRV